ncbi:hypothetical protein OH76DRAFT_1420508 [Lentinus brumalis]|uniref:Uncharacterized protein n=1 Tax=Lentinus brumalis TaxID=2498619 RepID=A0A371D095_9APHY|nr:hypothetical protein OH76DRAFT_1420508 [Polyporus brumalis]
MGSIVSAIGGGINAIISAIAGVIETIVSVIVSVWQPQPSGRWNVVNADVGSQRLGTASCGRNRKRTASTDAGAKTTNRSRADKATSAEKMSVCSVLDFIFSGDSTAPTRAIAFLDYTAVQHVYYTRLL